MSSILDRLLALRVSDVMNTRLITVREDQSMAEAAGILLENEVSGAPVVDAGGIFIGLLSAMDFVRKERELSADATDQLPADAPRAVLVKDTPQGPYRLTEKGGDKVSSFMSKAVQSVLPTASIQEAARMMCVLHVHRLPVFDEQGMAIGMVTSLDLVAALTSLVDEAKNTPQS